MPASASTSPSRGRSTAIPPKRPASASTAARWTSGRSSCAPGRRAAARRWPARVARPQRAARGAGQPLVELALEAGQPNVGVRRHAAHGQLPPLLGRRAGRRGPAISEASGPRSESPPRPGDRRAVARLDRRARRQPRVARQLLALAQPGEHVLRRASRCPARRPRAPHGELDRPFTRPKMRVVAVTSSATRSPSRARGPPVANPVSVAVVAARRRRGRSAAARRGRRAESASSPCIAA